MDKPSISTPALDRRRFLCLNAAAAGVLTANRTDAAELPAEFEPVRVLGNLKRILRTGPMGPEIAYAAEGPGDGLVYQLPPGILSRANYVSFDFLVDGLHLTVFRLILREGEDGPAFTLTYKGLNQCQARLRLPLEALDQNRWRLEREGAWLKPLCGGARVDPALLDRIELRVALTGGGPVSWRQGALRLTEDEPPRLEDPYLPKGPLLDELGQSTIHVWEGKSQTPAEVTERLKRQSAEAGSKAFPPGFNPWGGWTEKRTEATGFFRTHHDGRRWWLVDPDGHYFWSAGMDCVRFYINAFRQGLEDAFGWLPGPDGDFKDIYSNDFVNYLRANFIRAFGPESARERWAAVSLSLLRDFGFNTVANWSEWDIARAARFPYVRPLSTRLRRSRSIYRDFPDVYHSDFLLDAADYAQQLNETRDDPALIGYFLMNEPTWGFSSEPPAAGMLYTTETCETRKAFRSFLLEKYGSDAALSAGWGMDATLASIESGRWTKRLTREAMEDIYAFSERMVERFFGALSGECKKADPHHLNLGIRYQGVPPDWTVPGMKSFDVFSMNNYRQRVPMDACETVHRKLNLPVMIGEFHFGALDAGLPSPGLVRVPSQEDRGRAYRYYVEDAAANPYCVGTHYFTLYDQSAIGRFDGENYNIGFLDICNRPYAPLADAARTAHARMYELADGRAEPFNDPPEYLPRLF